MRDPLSLAAAAIDSVRVNRSWRIERDGRVVWHKRRRRGMALPLAAANVFLKLARSRLRMFVSRREWVAWELGCFARLHAPAYGSGGIDPWEIWFDEVPGVSCRDLLRDGALTTPCLEAAARELHRAHGLELSHGDAHLGNVIYDPAQRVARLVDFEQAHERDADAGWRQADDLLVFVLDLLGRAAANDWPALGVTFLRAYPEPAIADAVRARLIPPTGAAAVLWATRTNHLARALTAHRLEQLARAL